MIKKGRPRKFDRGTALKKAMEVFWKKGFENTSMPNLIEAMKINSPSIYAAFGSKEKLFLEAVELYSSTEGGLIWASFTTDSPAHQAIAQMLHTSAEEFTRADKPHGCLIALGSLHSEGGNEEIRETLKIRRAQCMSIVHERLQQGVNNGELPERSDWQAIATYYITLQQGMSIQARDGASREELMAVVNCAMITWDSIIASAD
jgi:AcrR family transcriptional regulator